MRMTNVCFTSPSFTQMIEMFDRNGSRTINFEEFQELWRFVTEWLNCFRSFDRDNSGRCLEVSHFDGRIL